MTKSHKILLTFPFVILNIVIEGENMYINQLVKKNLQSKVEANKSEKMNNLLDSAFKLFVDKGIKKTSIQDIVDQAGVAKGTFYLYFKDKYELQDVLLVRTSRQLFNEAYSKLKKQEEQPLEDKIIFLIDYILNKLINSKTTLYFIQKNLSLGIYSEKVTLLIDDDELGIKELFIHDVEKENLPIDNPEVTLFMILELVSSTAYTSITKDVPLPINEYKPILYKTIRTLLR